VIEKWKQWVVDNNVGKERDERSKVVHQWSNLALVFGCFLEGVEQKKLVSGVR
jgi:hypothetical protein